MSWNRIWIVVVIGILIILAAFTVRAALMFTR